MYQRIVAAAVAVVLLASCGGGPATKSYTQVSPAMEPTIATGAKVEADLVADGKYAPARGDIVVFRAPDEWELKGGDLAIKRVVAVGGETIGAGADGKVTVDGKALDEPYVKDGVATDGDLQVTVVPAGEIFVLGDNRAESADSALHGPVPAANVVAVVRAAGRT